MINTQRQLDFPVRPKLRLSEVERLIRRDRIIVPTPSRRALQRLCESGELDGIQLPLQGKVRHWFVFEDSFYDWVKAINTTTV